MFSKGFIILHGFRVSTSLLSDIFHEKVSFVDINITENYFTGPEERETKAHGAGRPTRAKNQNFFALRAESCVFFQRAEKAPAVGIVSDKSSLPHLDGIHCTDQPCFFRELVKIGNYFLLMRNRNIEASKPEREDR